MLITKRKERKYNFRTSYKNTLEMQNVVVSTARSRGLNISTKLFKVFILTMIRLNDRNLSDQVDTMQCSINMNTLVNNVAVSVPCFSAFRIWNAFWSNCAFRFSPLGNVPLWYLLCKTALFLICSLGVLLKKTC